MTNLWQLSVKKEQKDSSKVRDEKEVTTDSTRIQRILQGHYERLYDTKFNKTGKMDKFLEICDLPRVNHDKVENPNRPINCEESETDVMNFPES